MDSSGSVQDHVTALGNTASTDPMKDGKFLSGIILSERTRGDGRLYFGSVNLRQSGNGNSV